MITPDMLHPEYLAAKLNAQPRRFMELIGRRQYAAAKYCYDVAVDLATFLELPEQERILWFGNRPYVDDKEQIVDGLFPEELVQLVYRECAVKRNLGREMRQYGHPMERE